MHFENKTKRQIDSSVEEVESFNHFKPLETTLKKVNSTINCNLYKKMLKRSEKKRTGDLIDKFEQMNKPKKVR